VEPVDALREVCESWNQLDPDRLAALFTESASYEDPLKPAALIGPAEIRDGTGDGMAALEVCEITLSNIMGNDDRAFAEGFFRSAVGGGGRLDFPFALLVEMHNGKIQRVAEYFDTRPLVP
jgi:ketosteroid isomerase-like protein